MSHANPAVRTRAALAAGRIGNELAVPALVSLLQSDSDARVRAMAAFALGEVESPQPVEQLTAQLSQNSTPHLRSRIVEALGKIAAALPATAEAKKKEIGKTVLDVLNFEARRRSAPDTEVVLLALTATLRARPEGAGAFVAEFLSYSDSRIRSDAGNTLARLRAKDGNEQLRKLLTTDPDPNVRANAARVLGATEDKAAYDGLLDRALNDKDSRVRVSAVRALGSLRDSRAVSPLLAVGKTRVAQGGISETLEIVTTLGRLEQNARSKATIEWLNELQSLKAPEVEIAFARIHPQLYSTDIHEIPDPHDWSRLSAIGQGIAELANVKTGDPMLDANIKNEALRNLTMRLSCPRDEPSRRRERLRVRPGMVIAVRCTPMSAKALPDWLRAYAAFKPKDLAELLRQQLKDPDVIVRATAAELLGELPSDPTNTAALRGALTVALRDQGSNDAALAIIDALAKPKDRSANEAIMMALDTNDYIVRRKAIEALQASGGGDFSNRLVYVKTQNTARDYERAISRIGKRVLAVVNTSKGRFTIELLPEAAPLNVDNFVQLAKRRYFNGIVFHRVVPNFVVQGGDPRGDGNGGPGYQIRCEINEVPYQRGAVGMALSGKDTGGSQWFVTHAPQPHLDGGYTVFGNVVAGMEVVDAIVRGDTIRSIVVTEKPGPKTKSKSVDILIN
jgi:cyclophilin family peptidyl-prolyl cis-trans isomerase/HEAT repeat protein